MGILYIVSTPIGNREDITIRAIKTIFSVDYLLCEDTRKTGLLIQYLQEIATWLDSYMAKKPQLISYYEQNEFRRIPEVINYLKTGLNVALVSNAGTPTISDPGYKLVRECLNQKIKVVSIPGPSALLTGLVSSGLPTDKFIYLGYLPKKKSHRFKLFTKIKDVNNLLSSTFIFYESPQRIVDTLNDLENALGNIFIVICRELTKIHEEIKKDRIRNLIEYFTKTQPKGELTIVFSLKEKNGA